MNILTKKYVLITALLTLLPCLAFAQDSDNDGMPDDWELLNGLDTSIDDSLGDKDNDGLLNISEFHIGTKANQTDTDNDTLSDFLEVHTTYIDTEQKVNTLSTGSQCCSSVTCADNSYLVVWQDSLFDGHYDAVVAQRYDVYNNPIGSNFQVNTYTFMHQMLPVTASNGTDFLVVWESYLQDGDEMGIYGQMIGNSGNKIGTEFQVNMYTTSDQWLPAVASNGSTFLVTWQSDDQDGSGKGIYARLYDSTGSPLDAEFLVNVSTTGYQGVPAVASNGEGYLISWEGDDNDLYARLLDNDADPASAPFKVNVYTSGFQQDVSVGSDGQNYFIAWESQEQDGSYYGIFGIIYDNSGTPLSSEFQINTYTTGQQMAPSIASNGRYYLVTWYSEEQDGHMEGVFARFYDAIGTPIGDEFQVNDFTLMPQAIPSVAADTNSFMISWSSYYQDGSLVSVYTKHIKKSDPTNPDSDDDGLSDGDEVTASTDLFNPDTDNDGMPDGWEFFYLLNPLVDDSDNDADYDGLSNLDELNYNTNPNNPDSDGDGMNDGDEVYVGMEPDNADSLFSIILIGVVDTPDGIKLQWHGSVSNPSIVYTIHWGDSSGNGEIELDSGDIDYDNGVYTWIDRGDNTSLPPRPFPTDSRLYSVVVE